MRRKTRHGRAPSERRVGAFFGSSSSQTKRQDPEVLGGDFILTRGEAGKLERGEGHQERERLQRAARFQRGAGGRLHHERRAAHVVSAVRQASPRPRRRPCFVERPALRRHEVDRRRHPTEGRGTTDGQRTTHGGRAKDRRTTDRPMDVTHTITLSDARRTTGDVPTTPNRRPKDRRATGGLGPAGRVVVTAADCSRRAELLARRAEGARILGAEASPSRAQTDRASRHQMQPESPAHRPQEQPRISPKSTHPTSGPGSTTSRPQEKHTSFSIGASEIRCIA